MKHPGGDTDVGEGCKEFQFDHEKRIAAVEASAKSAHHRIDEVVESNKVLMEISGNIKILAEQNKTQNEKIDKIEGDVSELKGKPGQYWDKAIGTIITVVVGGVAGAGLTLILK